jgi:hypothetical protein
VAVEGVADGSKGGFLWRCDHASGDVIDQRRVCTLRKQAASEPVDRGAEVRVEGRDEPGDVVGR